MIIIVEYTPKPILTIKAPILHVALACRKVKPPALDSLMADEGSSLE